MEKLKQGWKAYSLPILMVAGYVFFLLLHLRIQPYSDDIWYIETARTKDNFFTLQWDYYLSWSGRVVSSALSFFLLDKAFWLWRLLNPALMVCMTWAIDRIVQKKPDSKMFALTMLLLLCLGPGVLDYAIFWATGSLYYLWPITGALFALHPFFDLAFRGEVKIRGYVPRAVLALLCVLGNEQLTLCVLGFMVVCLAGRWLKTKKAPGWRYWLMLALSGVGALVLFLAPGNSIRYMEESYLKYYLKFFVGFPETPLLTKASRGTAWVFEMLFGVLFVSLVLLMAFCWLRRYSQRQGRARLPMLAVLGLAAALSFPSPVEPVFTFADLEETFVGEGLAQGLLALLPYLFWLGFLGVIGYVLVRENLYLAIAYAAALCTVVMMTFSPTIYASGPRTLMVAGVIIVAVCLALAKERITPVVLTTVGMLAAVSVARLVTRLPLFYGG